MKLLSLRCLACSPLIFSIKVFAFLLCFSSLAVSQENQQKLGYLSAIYTLFDSEDSPVPQFSVSMPEPFTGDVYEIDTDEWDINTNKTNSIETTTRIQAAIDDAVDKGFERIFLPSGDYLVGMPLERGAVDIFYRGIELPSNVEFTLADDAQIFMAPNDKWNYCVIRVSNGENVVIKGGTLIGDRYEHIYTPRSNGQANHDEGHGICLEGGNNILIEDMVFKELTGDGVLVIAKAHDITIRNSEMSTNRRQGVSVVGSYRVNIQNNYIHDIRGSNPEFGVDIETGGTFAGFDRDIIIQNNRFYGNRGGSVLNATGRNVFIRNNTMTEHSDPKYRYTTAPITMWQKSDAVITGNTISKREGTAGDGIIEYRGGFLGEDDGTRTIVIHDNTCRGCGMILRPSTSGVDIRNNRFGGHIFWLLDVKNATIIGNNHEGSSPSNCFSFRFQNVTGEATQNTFNDEPYDLPLDPTTPYSNGCPFTNP